MKRIKYLLLVILMIPFIVEAENLEIVDMDYETSEYTSGILYSDGKLFLAGKYLDEYNTMSYKTYENVKKFNIFYGGRYIYLTNDNKLFDGNNIHENIKDFVADLNNYDYRQDIFYLDNDNNLYSICVSFNCHLASNEETLISENVKDVKLISNGSAITLLYLTNDNELYFLGNNYFGNKINSGNDTNTPIKLLNNVKEFGSRYAIDNDNNMYLFYEKDPRPTIYSSNIKKVLVDDIYQYNEIKYIVVETNDNERKLLYLNDNNIKTISINISVKKITNNYLLSSDNKLYYIDNNSNYEIVYLDDNVKDISMYRMEYYNNMFIYLKTNGELYTIEGYYVNNWKHRYDVPDLVKKLYISEYANKPILYLKNVKSIEFAHKNYIILNNNKILRTGNGNYGIFFGEPYTESLIPVQINDLINNNKEIKVDQIYLSFKDVYDYTIGDEFDAYATAIPYNSSNKELIWDSSNKSVAEVNSEGYVVTKGVGSTTISVKTSDNSVTENATINVYPKPSGIEITNGETIEIGRDERILLNVKVSPDNTIKKGVIWEELDNEDDYSHLYSYYYDEDGKEVELPDNQRVFRIYKGGTYRIKVSTEDNKYSDIITINVVEKVEYIKVDIPKSNYDGYNAFIFLFENNELQVTATAYEETANNRELKWSSSNTDVATVTQNGLIKGLKAGRSIIKIDSVDGGASRQFNVIVYDSEGHGSDETETKITSTPKISVTKYQENQVIVSSNVVNGATSYEIYRSTSKTKNYKKINTVNMNSYLDTINYGTTYYYKIIAKNSISKSKYSNIVSIKVLPDKVSNLKSSSINSNSIKLEYDKVNTTGYEIYRSTNNKKWSKVATISNSNTTIYTNSKLKANTTYYYKVRAYKTVGKKKIYGNFSNVLKVKTAPSKSTLTITNSDYNKLDVSFNKISGASKYILEMSSDNVTFEKVNEYTTNSKYIASDLETGKTYYFRINVCNSNNDCSGYNTFKKQVVPKTPSLTLKTSSKKVTINVNSVNGVDGYEIYRSNYSNKKFTLIKEFTNEDEILEYINSTTKGKTYYYKVRAYKIVNDTKVYSSYSGAKKIKSK